MKIGGVPTSTPFGICQNGIANFAIGAGAMTTSLGYQAKPHKTASGRGRPFERRSGAC